MPNGTAHALPLSMGKIDNTKILYVCGGLIIGLGIFFALLLSNKTSGFFKSQSHRAGEISSVSHPRIGRSKLGKAPRTTWKKTGEHVSTRVQRYDSGHEVKQTFASDYVAPTEVNHPLVASTKFLKKNNKGKLKKRSKLAKGRSGLSGKGSTTDVDDDGSLDPLSESPSSSSSISTMAGSSSPNKPTKKEKPEDEEENINTVEFWHEPIFVEADPKAVTKLISSYQVKKVSSNVFYDVVTQMNENPNIEIREFGVMALGSTPSTMSFAQLTWVKHNDDDAAIRNEAGRHVASYADAKRVGYVVNALRPLEETKVTLEALRSISESVGKYGNLQAQQGADPRSSVAVDLKSLEPRYERARELIEQNHTNSPDALVKTEATKAVAAINKFMPI